MQLMNLYKTIKKPIFDFIWKIFEIINCQSGNLQVCDEYYATNNFQSLLAIDCFWLIVLESEDEQVQELHREKLSNLYSKINQGKTQEVWKLFIEKCLQYLKEFETNQKKVGNLISLFKLFIMNCEGKKYFKENYPSKRLSSFDLEIQFPNNSIKKDKIELPSNCTLYQLKRKIKTQFQLMNYEIQIILSKINKILSSNLEESLSVITLENQRYRDKDLIIKVIDKKQSTGQLPRQLFKQYLQNCSSIAENLVLFLSNSNPIISDQTLKILKYVPFNKQMFEEITQLKLQNEQIVAQIQIESKVDQWDLLLDKKCYKKLLYQLKIIESILENLQINSSSQNPDQIKWCNEFCEMGGFLHIFEIFMAIQNED
eukprot:TRINITY_DN37099_c0_g1_i1.p2 TRINITY_DN37099_c0_g1~~TRINITY_DN37099_c0_g1_i1.p2  ORF type:complete len:371 (+),score=57.71 TRINITY_DN37099_c0_g1_i1:701-1813(+)